MKICLIAPIPPYRGGITKYCYCLAQELEKRHELLLLSYRRQYPKLLFGNKSQIDPEVDREEILKEFARLSYALDSANPVSWWENARAILKFKPDLVVIPWWVAYWTPLYLYLLNLFKGRGIKAVVLCINVFEHEHSALKDSLTRLVLGRADALIVHSEKEREQVRSFNRRARVEKHLLPLFGYHPAPAAAPGDERLNLLFFGFVRPYKGLDTLLCALGMLKDREVRLRIAGEFWGDRESYLGMIGELGIADRVELIDRYVTESEMSSFFAEADLVVLPYKKSITSGVIATAYGFGKPVLATTVGGFPEVVRDGVTGKLVEPDSPRALAEGIVWFLENRQIDYAGNIRGFAADCMSWKSLADLIESFA